VDDKDPPTEFKHFINLLRAYMDIALLILHFNSTKYGCTFDRQ
jgi:hypothetical protein